MIKDIQIIQNDTQLHWFLDHISQDLSQISDTLNTCLRLLSNPDSIKLPITYNNLLTGIIIRDGPFLKNLRINGFKFKNLHITQPFELVQIKQCQLLIIDSIEILENFHNIKNQSHDHHKYVSLFTDLKDKINLSKQLLQLPCDPNLVFPNNIPNYDLFNPTLPTNFTMDIYINQGNLCIDFKKLHVIHDEPWCSFINGKSFIDIVKEDLKLGKIKVQDLDNLEELKIYKDLGINSTFTWFKKFKPIDYVTKCITFNSMVVMIDKNIEVNTSDPILISVLTKLDTLDYLITKYLDNLRMLVGYSHK